MHDPVLTVDEIAAHLRISRATVYRMMKRSAFPGFRVGAGWRCLMSEVDKWILRQENEARRGAYARG